MKTNKKISALIATECGPNGAYGDTREVLSVAIVDYGGNELGRATTPKGVRRVQSRYRIATRLLPIKLGARGVDYLDGYTLDCGLCDPD